MVKESVKYSINRARQSEEQLQQHHYGKLEIVIKLVLKQSLSDLSLFARE